MHAQHQDSLPEISPDFARGFDAAQLRMRQSMTITLGAIRGRDARPPLASAWLLRDGKSPRRPPDAAESAPDERVIVDKQPGDFMRHDSVYPEGPQAARVCARRAGRYASTPADQFGAFAHSYEPNPSLHFSAPQTCAHDLHVKLRGIPRKTSAGIHASRAPE